jgi:hypothetical protein
MIAFLMLHQDAAVFQEITAIEKPGQSVFIATRIFFLAFYVGTLTTLHVDNTRHITFVTLNVGVNNTVALFISQNICNTINNMYGGEVGASPPYTSLTTLQIFCDTNNAIMLLTPMLSVQK